MLKLKTFCLILTAFIITSAMAIETPKYSVLESFSDDIELREYQSHLIAEVEVTGRRAQASSKAFGILAGFIFGNNTSDTKIAMTAPVSQQASNAKETKAAGQEIWRVNFSMPKKFTQANLPVPNDSRIQIREVPTHKVLAIRFAGRISEKNIAKHDKKIKKFIQLNEYSVISEPRYAFYDRPITLPAQRRNEILYQLIENLN